MKGGGKGNRPAGTSFPILRDEKSTFLFLFYCFFSFLDLQVEGLRIIIAFRHTQRRRGRIEKWRSGMGLELQSFRPAVWRGPIGKGFIFFNKGIGNRSF